MTLRRREMDLSISAIMAVRREFLAQGCVEFDLNQFGVDLRQVSDIAAGFAGVGLPETVGGPDAINRDRSVLRAYTNGQVITADRGTFGATGRTFHYYDRTEDLNPEAPGRRGFVDGSIFSDGSDAWATNFMQTVARIGEAMINCPTDANFWHDVHVTSLHVSDVNEHTRAVFPTPNTYHRDMVQSINMIIPLERTNLEPSSGAFRVAQGEHLGQLIDAVPEEELLYNSATPIGCVVAMDELARAGGEALTHAATETVLLDGASAGVRRVLLWEINVIDTLH